MENIRSSLNSISQRNPDRTNLTGNVAAASASSPSKPSCCSDTNTSGYPSPYNLHLSSPAFQFEFRKLSVSCPLQFNGQLPDGVFNVRTSFQSRPSLVALGAKASSMTKFPVFVQTYSSSHPESDEVHPDAFERKDSALIIAPAPEEPDHLRQFDFCQVSVLLCELLLLAGVLVFTFAFSMKTSPSIHSVYTPYWAGVPLVITGSIGMGLHCRKWHLNDFTMIPEKFIIKSFIFILVLSGIISLIGFSFSLYFFTTLVSLEKPRMEIDAPQLQAGTNYDAVQIKCIFNRSNWKREIFAANSTSRMEFLVRKHMPTTSDCENFLFNIANYSLMQCIILLMAAFVSLTILVKTLVHESFMGSSHVTKLQCCQITDEKEKCEKSEVNHSERSVAADDVMYNAKAESPSTYSFSSSFGQRTDSFDSDGTKHSSSNICFNRSRFRYYSNTESELPGVIIESSDDITNDDEFTTC